MGLRHLVLRRLITSNMSLRDVLCRHWLSKQYVVVGPAGAHGGVLLGVVMGLLGGEGGEEFRRWRAKLKGAAGVSIGSLFAVAVAMGMDPQRVRYLLKHFPFGEIFSEDGKLVLERGLAAGGLEELSKLQGVMSGASLFTACEYVMAAAGLRTDVTFAQLHQATGGFDLRIVATDLGSLRPVVFSHQATPETTIIYAMAASMCIPIMFKPIRVKGGFSRRFTCVDGAVSDPFGLCAFPEELAKGNVLFVCKNVNLNVNNRCRTIASILQSTLLMATQVNLSVARMPFQNMVFGLVGGHSGKDETEVASWAQLLDSPETDEFVADGIRSVDHMVLTHLLFVLLYGMAASHAHYSKTRNL
jgi:predicted acylesterase/phospholipase RssA